MGESHPLGEDIVIFVAEPGEVVDVVLGKVEGLGCGIWKFGGEALVLVLVLVLVREEGTGSFFALSHPDSFGISLG